MARRMNVEAAKAVKYGGLAPHDALRFVTLNPARQLRVDDRIGSLEPGKDGDFVIWSGDPLSPRARCEATWIEGRELFSLATDRELRAWNARERARIVQKVLASKPEAKDEGKESKIELTPIAGKPTGEELAAEVERVHRRHLAQQLRTGRRCACAFPQEEDR
jgi:N-acetylglucosamine-6-phosphate deacetylase